MNLWVETIYTLSFPMTLIFSFLASSLLHQLEVS